MKNCLLVLLTILVIFTFVACDSSPSTYSGGNSVYNSLAADTKAAIETVGEVDSVYEEDTGRFINGQELRKNFTDKNGNPIPLVFNSWLIAYRSFFPSFKTLFDGISCNAMLHNNHGYNLMEMSDIFEFIEYCEYRFLEDTQYNKKGDLCFIELRVVCDDIAPGKYYAKSFSFDPTLRYEISTLGLDLLTGKFVYYDLLTREVTPLHEKALCQYNDDADGGTIIIVDENGQIKDKRTFEYEFDTDGFLRKNTEYYSSGVKYCETLFNPDNENSTEYFEYDESGTETRHNIHEINYDTNTITNTWFFANGVVSSIEEYSLNGRLKKRTEFYPSGIVTSVSLYDELVNFKCLSYTHYNESGEIDSTAEYEYNPTGNLVLCTEKNASGLLYRKTVFDGTSTSSANYNRISMEQYDESGNLEWKTEFSESGFDKKIIQYYPSGAIRLERVFDGTEAYRRISENSFYENGNPWQTTEYYSNGNQKSTLSYDESGTLTWKNEFNESGFKTKEIQYYPSGFERLERIYDGTEAKLYVSEKTFYENGALNETTVFDSDGIITSNLTYDESGNLTRKREYSESGFIRNEIQYFPSGTTKREIVYDGTEAYRKISENSFYENGNPWKTTEYYSNGKQKVSFSYDESGTLTWKNEFNESGFQTKEIQYYPSGSIKRERIFDGTEAFRQISEDIFRENGALWQAIEFDSEGKITASFTYDESGNLQSYAEYDSEENIIASFTYDESGNLNWKMEYNDQGYRVKEIQYYPSGSVQFERVIDGTEAYRVINERSFRENGTLQFYAEYDSDGKIIADFRYNASEILWLKTEYNGLGFITKEIFYYSSGAIQTEKIYDGSENGNLISQTDYDEEGNITSQS